MMIVEMQVRGDSGHTYTLKANAQGTGMYCTCPAWKFKGGKLADRTCKHVEFAARMLLAAV